MSIDVHDPEPLIPGAYERSTLTHRQPGSMGADPAVAVLIGSSSMDAATIAAREREGGGAPSERRRAVEVRARTPQEDVSGKRLA